MFVEPNSIEYCTVNKIRPLMQNR